MNAPAIIQPGAEALKALFLDALAANSATIDAKINRLCSLVEKFATASGEHTACPAGGCNSEGKPPCKDCASKPTPVLGGVLGDAWTGLVTAMQARGCGTMCRPLNPCFLWALQVMLTRVSLRRLYWMLERDDESAELTVNAGNAIDYINILTTAMVSNRRALLAMSPSQMLPLVPAVSKATAVWTGDPVITNVNLTLYQGAKGLTNLSPADVAAQLVPLGNTKALSKWFCTAPDGKNGNCFVRPFPPFLGCSGSVIPDTEALYLLIETGNIGASTLTGLTFEVIKSGTSDSVKYCRQCEVPTDAYGTPINLGPWA